MSYCPHAFLRLFVHPELLSTCIADFIWWTLVYSVWWAYSLLMCMHSTRWFLSLYFIMVILHIYLNAYCPYACLIIVHVYVLMCYCPYAFTILFVDELLSTHIADYVLMSMLSYCPHALLWYATVYSVSISYCSSCLDVLLSICLRDFVFDKLLFICISCYCPCACLNVLLSICLHDSVFRWTAVHMHWCQLSVASYLIETDELTWFDFGWERLNIGIKCSIADFFIHWEGRTGISISKFLFCFPFIPPSYLSVKV